MDKASEFIEVTGVPNEVAEKYLACFGSFEEAVEHFLETRSHSPVRPPDLPYNEVMIQASPVKKKEKLTKITIDKTRSFKDRLKSASNLDLLFRPSPHAQAGTFDSVKKKATFLKKALLVSLFDDTNFSCIQQNRDIWSSQQFLDLNTILFFQIRANSDEGISFNQLYPRETEDWPHAVLIEPKTGIKLDQWEGKSVFDDCQKFLTALTQSINSNISNTNPGIKSKKRTHENIIDQDEDAQIAIALAASMKNKKRQKTQHSGSDDDQSDGAEPEMNSDFESIDGDDLEDGTTDEDFEEEKLTNVKPVEENVEDKKSSGTSIEISIRLPDKRICIKCLSNSDCIELKTRFESEGYPLSNYELIRAYPREKIEISPGISIEDLNIRNQDAFHLQLKQ